jgi:hypothetical protein
VKRLSILSTRAFAATLAAALVAALLPFGPAVADEEPTESPSSSDSPTETPDPSEQPTEEPSETTEPEPSRGFSGYTSAAWAAPVKIEIYEPMIPIPTTPQAELELAYSEVESDSTTSRGRSSFIWPGAPIGEGFKTFVEQFGLPPDLGKDGYPVQVNSLYPAGPDYEADEPFPGMVQRAGSDEGSAYAETGFSTDAQSQDRDSGEGDDGGLIPGLPLPGLDGLTGLLSAPSQTTGPDGEEVPASLGLPPALAAIVDLGGFTSVSRTETVETVSAMARSSFGDIALLGGLVRIEGLKVRAEASSDGTSGTSGGLAAYGELVALGQRFSFGPDGFEAVGQSFPIPGLPDEVWEALSTLGIAVKIPKPVYEKDGDSASAAVTGLVVELDMAPLKKLLNTLPLADLLGAIPEEAGQLKDALALVTGLSSRVVVSLGNARATVDTSAAIEPPVIEPEEPETEESAGEDTGAAAPAGNTPPITTPASTDPPPAGTTTAPPGDLDAAPAGAGLPPLFSIPGLLLVGGIALATVAGSYFRRMGAAALGGGAPCPHGLDSGLPDLRKA